MVNQSMKYAVVIPARFESSRFPGKPLVDLKGKPMIQRVWEKCCEAVSSEFVYVATDSEKIKNVCVAFGAKVVMTSSDCKTGTDRVAEANKTIQADIVINVQGDEPLISPNDIKKILNASLNTPSNIINAMCPITNESEFRSTTVPKVVASPSGKLLYMSRAGIPLSKNASFHYGNKQVCIYAFSKEHLEFFYSFTNKTPLESVEDIEILRFLEGGFDVHMVGVDEGPIAIDIPSDVSAVLERL